MDENRGFAQLVVVGVIAFLAGIVGGFLGASFGGTNPREASFDKLEVRLLKVQDVSLMSGGYERASLRCDGLGDPQLSMMVGGRILAEKAILGRLGSDALEIGTNDATRKTYLQIGSTLIEPSGIRAIQFVQQQDLEVP